MNIKDLDLNLLKIFDTLYKEKNLTRVAKLMALSQPAISHSLARLRDFFEDPLFVREGNLMVPTTRAQNIYDNINRSLKTIQQTIEDKGRTEPARSSRTFVLGLSNYCSVTVLPDLIEVLEKKAPSINIRTQHLTLAQKTRCLEDNTIDLVIGCSKIQKAGIKQQKLFSDKEVCIAGDLTGIPENGINLDNIGQYSLIRLQTSQHEKSDIFQTLDERKIQFKSTFTTDQEFIIPQIVASTRHIGIVAEKIALKYKNAFGYEIYPIKEIETKFTIRQYWHMRQDNDPVHKWFRKLLLGTCRQIDTI